MEKDIKKDGITGYQLKMIGVILMVFDHIHQMFYYAGDLEWLRILGRPVLPIFLFMCAEGYYHTRSKKKYALRLLIAAVAMRIGTSTINTLFPITKYEVNLMNNVFYTMFVSVIVMMAIDSIREKKFLKAILFFAIPLLGDVLLNVAIFTGNVSLISIVLFLPMYLAVEGGFTAVILAVLFYVFRENRMKQSICLIIVSFIGIVLNFVSKGFSISFVDLFTQNIQWMMVFSLIPISLYNGQRGKSSKYFFYIFYPAHIFALYIIAYVLIKNGVL
ncbi:TraX family protein [Facklamia miroungae]|uniref:TraX protein n=1 Tax=Facklamia miroungae TaxID=120956 RepID=A0A1G7QBB1_9LACT|nr:TraX family protein [Facklamia miroungae]NKZ28860.1 hypothetical protein [Facklamia miroungae]SDF94880.1 TraX protein [Facklamia miroungae]